jgi:hypothetical protein
VFNDLIIVAIGLLIAAYGVVGLICLYLETKH